MLSEERRRKILELMRKEGRVLVRELSHRFRTSQITIRKDLESLHHDGQLERTHGGALPKENGALKDSSLQEKARRHRPEKARIAAAAAQKIRAFSGRCLRAFSCSELSFRAPFSLGRAPP